MHGFRDNKVLMQAGYDVIVISPPGEAESHFLIADSEKATPILCKCCIVTTCLSCTDFQFNELSLLAENDIIAISSPGDASGNF